MKYAARTADGQFTGAIYDALTPEITAHHVQYGEVLVATPGLANHGTDEAPDWRSIAVTPDAVNLERARRITAGTDITVTGYDQPIALQGRAEDRQALIGLAMMAQMLISAGSVPTMTFRDRLNVAHDLTPAQVIELWQRGTLWMQEIYQASWSLKDADPIPENYADDTHWPAAPAATPET